MIRNVIILAIIMITGCTPGSENKVDGGMETTASDSTGLTQKTLQDSVIDGCYMQVLKRDTFAASLQQQGAFIHGKMNFNNYEKDKSSGTVSGKMEGDIIKLNYTFLSEGTKSVMELYFKYKDGNLIQGNGEMNMRGDTAYFVNPAQITYSDAEFKKIACQDLPAKYK